MQKSRTFLALAAALAVTAPAAAQDILMPATPEKGVWLEASYSDFKGVDVSFPSTVWFLSGRVPLTGSLSAMVDVPFSYARTDAFGTGTESSTVLGNPYLGVQFAATERLALELGTRVPLTTADDESFADVLAFLANPQRGEAFVKDIVPLSVGATLTQPLSSSFDLRGRLGGAAFFYTGDEEDVDTETAVDYGLAGTYTTGPARLGLGLSGRWFASQDEGSFGTNSVHHLGLSADYRVGGVRPGITVRLPLDSEYRDVLRSTVGLYLQVPVR